MPANLARPIEEALTLCNRAVHGEAIRDQDAHSVIESGVELLQVLESLNREYGIAHPISKEMISDNEVEKVRAARYCIFRRSSDTHSDSYRTVIPIQSGHLFRLISDSDSDFISDTFSVSRNAVRYHRKGVRLASARCPIVVGTH